MSDTDTAAENAPAAAPDTDATAAGADYRVLARKYRPTTFSGLIGQDVLVRTLTNAIKTGRLAHAFMLTGVRGVGKTTTARIIARALNCIGPDGQGGPTTEPCGRCANCIAISEDRHVDVLEMDAASRTGVDDIRELIDGVRYRPTSARYKVYIIDEVHMLTKNAFNALLKTLEEPPEQVKFVFATTEIRKVPVTVLSRCQRFDLRRVDVGLLENHFGAIAEKEGASLSATALYLIARAADGSVRDGLSLLDQAISRADGEITDTQVRDMLGLADRSQSYELLEAAMAGDAAAALAIIEDLLEVVHLLTRVKVVPAVLEDPALPEIERRRGRELTERLSMPALSRAWQMLLKAMGEVRTAPSARQAADMALV
ncbi:MAG: DNA polymerase III subunit gamma/tau, partial [Rhodospirillaceae bacterium]